MDAEKPEPATLLPVDGPKFVEQFADPLNLINTQASALRKQFALGYYVAATLAPLVYGVGPR
jgi:hypothetical protein